MIDTHVVVWLYTNSIEKISLKAQQFIESSQLLISPIVLLELQYLFEIGKLLTSSKEIYEDLHFRIGLEIDRETIWSRIIQEAIFLSWTRDPFDRLIVAHTSILKCPLITRDQSIQLNFNKAIW